MSKRVFSSDQHVCFLFSNSCLHPWKRPRVTAILSEDVEGFCVAWHLKITSLIDDHKLSQFEGCSRATKYFDPIFLFFFSALQINYGIMNGNQPHQLKFTRHRSQIRWKLVFLSQRVTSSRTVPFGYLGRFHDAVLVRDCNEGV